ncbi:MAG: hypothetical protein R3D98_17740 [Candidatus Krumholzibacteriia bacterium]
MRISRKSPRKSDAFRSRFLEAGKAAAPIRHARRLREHLAGEVILFALQLGFLVALVFFGRAVANLFHRHGAHLNPWYLRMCLLGVVVCFVLMARRVWTRGRDIRETRQELRQAQQQMDDLRHAVRRGEDV